MPETEVVLFREDDGKVPLSHGVVKEREVPAAEIDAAVRRRARFTANPEAHTFEE